MNRNIRPILATAIWFGAFAAGAAFAGEGVSANAPGGKNIFLLPSGLEGKYATYEAMSTKTLHTLDGSCAYKVYGVRKWTQKSNTAPDGSKQPIWVRNDKTTINVSEGELGSVVNDFSAMEAGAAQ